MPADLRGSEICERLLATRHAAECQFKTMNMRESEFRKQKLIPVDKQLAVSRIAREREEREEAQKDAIRHSPTSPNSKGPTTSPKKAIDFRPRKENMFASNHPSSGYQSAPDLWGFGATWPAPSPNGIVVSRFGASVPNSNHPAMHPGAIVLGPHGLRRSSSAVTAFPSMDSFGAGMSSPVASPEGKMRPRPAQLDRTAGGASATTLLLGSPPASPDYRPRHELVNADTSPSSPSSPAVRREQRQNQNASSVNMNARPGSPNAWSSGASNEELFWNPASFKEDQFLFDSEDSVGGFNGGARPTERPEVIERLGCLMAALGPRYKTVSRDALWERARIGETTPLQRQLARGAGPGHGEHGGGAKKVKKATGPKAQKPVSIVESPDDDPDGRPRADWLVARSREKERREQAHQKALGFLQLPVKG